jgi:hypothetical protein
MYASRAASHFRTRSSMPQSNTRRTRLTTIVLSVYLKSMTDFLSAEVLQSTNLFECSLSGRPVIPNLRPSTPIKLFGAKTSQLAFPADRRGRYYAVSVSNSTSELCHFSCNCSSWIIRQGSTASELRSCSSLFGSMVPSCEPYLPNLRHSKIALSSTSAPPDPQIAKDDVLCLGHRSVQTKLQLLPSPHVVP